MNLLEWERTDNMDKANFLWRVSGFYQQKVWWDTSGYTSLTLNTAVYFRIWLSIINSIEDRKMQNRIERIFDFVRTKFRNFF